MNYFVDQAGKETYENQKKYASEVFKQLENIHNNGIIIAGCWHEIDVVCCCDWKAGACLEGKSNPISTQK